MTEQPKDICNNYEVVETPKESIPQSSQDAQGKVNRTAKATEHHSAITNERKRSFLNILEQKWPNIAECAKSIGVSRQSVFEWRTNDPELAKAWDEIEQAKIDIVENHVLETCLTRGGAGYAFPILKAYRRHIWGERLEMSGQLTQVHLVSGVRTEMTSDDRARIEQAETANVVN